MSLVKYWLKLLVPLLFSVCNDDSPFRQYDTSDETDIADEPPTNHASHQTVTELFNSALFLRSIIMSMKNTVPEVPLAVDLSPDKIDAPVPLCNFLVWLIGGCTTDEDSNISMVERGESSEECHCHFTSVLQDLVHCTRRGRIPTCKHLALPSTVHHLTRSQQVVNLLNRFGHGYSSSRTLMMIYKRHQTVTRPTETFAYMVGSMFRDI